ncbi:kinase non-catalytic C-lobe domain-containing protein 1 [Pelobates fuscus]|uniref:kinase non-catalytic C-lobe domain-containing protein 1 n=1 Tax=Pelobates fuscus TaxID=191477 RepID=UPI002FE4B98D
MEEAEEVEEYYEEEEEDGKEFYDFQPLPTLLEDEENVSLADILSLRDNCLTEQDIWAICLECCYSMKSIAHSAIFQTLCITPDTLAFNTNGNICFMEQLSDDPEGDFVPPEFDLTGNTLEAHIYSLGATLKAAIEFVIEPEVETEMCQDLQTLLDLMQQETPADRPDIESIISLCENKLNSPSSSMICRNLSSIGRRVLSIESVSALQDGLENLWKGIDKMDRGMKLQAGENVPVHTMAVIDNPACSRYPDICRNILTSQEIENKNWWREPDIRVEKPYTKPCLPLVNHVKKNKGDRTQLLCLEKYENCEKGKLEDEMSRLSLKKHRRNKPQPGASMSEKRSFSPSPPPVGKTTLKSWPSMPSCLSPNEDIENEESLDCRDKPKNICFVDSKTSNNTMFSNISMPKPKNCNSPLGRSEFHSQVSYENLVAALAEENQHSQNIDEPMTLGNNLTLDQSIPHPIRHNGSKHVRIHERLNPVPDHSSDIAVVSRLNNSPEQCSDIEEENEEQEWISLKDLLLRYGQPLKEEELWALCHECLCTLQTYIDCPAVLCLESVLIDHRGEVLFVPHLNEEPYDALCVPPEYDPEGVGTEKGCVYGIAAILWSSAKLNFPCNHKLALPKKLKRFLLHMAKRDSDERPNLTEALQVCRNYLQPRSIDGKDTWANLYRLAYQCRPNSGFQAEPSNFSETSSGFLPVSTTSKLKAVKGPVPMKEEHLNLPAAFTSSASYFKPIILMQNEDTSGKKTPYSSGVQEFGDSVENYPFGEDISVTDLEDNTEDKTSENQNCVISPRTLSSNKANSTVSDCLSDCKENISSAASSISSSSSTLRNSPLINNYLLKQDPKTGSLKLVRVHLNIPDHIQNGSLESESVVFGTVNTSSTVTNNDVNINNFKNSEKLPISDLSICKETHTKVNDVTSELPLTNGVLTSSSNTARTHEAVKDCENKTNNVSELNAANGDSPDKRTVSSPLQKVVDLIRDEFAFDGYLENGIEDLAMGEYIFSLEGLQYTTFCGAISEKFCDLYWDDQLLENLFQVVNGKSPPSFKTNPKDHCIPTQILKRVHRRSRKSRKHEQLSTLEEMDISNNSNEVLTPQKEMSPVSQRRPLIFNSGTETQVVVDTSRRASFDEVYMTDIVPETTKKDQQSQSPNVTRPFEENSRHRELSVCNHYCLSPDFTEEHEENLDDSIVRHRDSSQAMSISPDELYKCSTGWTSAFYGAKLFDSEVHQYVNFLGRQKDKYSETIEAKRLELEQQLMIETKNYRKTIKLYQNSLLKGKKNKGSDVKELLPKLKGHLEEMKIKVQFLELCRKLLQVSYAEQWGVEPHVLPTVAKCSSQEKDRGPDEDTTFMLIYNQRGKTSHNNTSKSLQSGTSLGLMVHLYSCNAFHDGYVQHFLYTFRYFCSQEDLLQFFIEQIDNHFLREGKDPSPLEEKQKVYHRSLVLLQTWIEDCWHIDFISDPDLLDKLEHLSNSQVLPQDEYGDYLLSLLQEISNRKYTFSSPSFNSGDKKEDTKSLHSLCTKLSDDNISRKSFNWKLSKGNGSNVFNKDKHYSLASALPRPCYPSIVEDYSPSYMKGDENGMYSIYECSVGQIASQLTILQEEMFQKCHPVHFLNSRALGVKDKSTNVPKAFFAETLPAEVCSLFMPNCTQDKYLLQLLRFADNVSSWVAAEIVTSATSKLQASVLTKFLLVAKLCYEQRDFASAVQILVGLENLIVRQLPAWKSLPSKVCEILEELKAVEVFLKSDSLCLMKGDRFRTLPTIPSAYVLAMHIQQLETGGFTMANGAFKWNKLRNIAKVVSQVHAFQEIPYSFVPDPELQFYLRQRIAHFSDADISALAASNNTNFHHMPSEKHSRKIQDTLRRMKATFQ